MSLPTLPSSNVYPERHDRLTRVEQYLLRGYSNPKTLAVRFGVDELTMRDDIQEIKTVWWAKSSEEAAQQRLERVRQLEYVIQVAHDSFIKSRKDAEEQSDTTSEVPCGGCKGSGMRGMEWCATCDGRGVVSLTVRAKRAKGQAGDSSFLAIVTKCITEIAKLEGAYAPRQLDIRGQVAHAHLHAAVGGSGGVSSVDQLMAAPMEVLIGAKMAIARLRESIRSGKREQDAIEANAEGGHQDGTSNSS